MKSARPRLALIVVGVALGALTLLPVLRRPASAESAQPAQSVKSKPAGGDAGVEMTAVRPAEIAPGTPHLSPVYGPARASAFDHARHAAKGITCDRCHGGAAKSTSAADNLLPAEAVCRGCHVADAAQAPVGIPALPDIPARPALLPAGVKFNHALHLQRGVACGLCHAGVEDAKAWRAEDHLPSMALCLGCHDGKQATSRCAACHPTLPDGRLKTWLPGGRLIPTGSLRGADAHTAGFRTQHKIAGRDQRYCTTCHKQSECLDCHGAGVVRPTDFHPLDYATLHAVDARRNQTNCSACHRNQTFCLGCHQRLGVAAEPEGGQAGRQPQNPFGTGTQVKRFHPPGWVRDANGTVLTTPSPASHSVQARRNLRACTSCHREDGCLDCHSADPTRSLQISPHPSGFRQSPACEALARNLRACLKCHTPDSPALGCD